MALGSYMGMTFTVSDRRILTPSGLKGQGGSDWATHNRTGARARSQWIAPKLRKYQFDLLLRGAGRGKPAKCSAAFSAHGGDQRGELVHRWAARRYRRIRSRSRTSATSGGAVLHGGAMVECKVSLTIEEYL